MAYATGLRLIAAVCYLSIIGIPLGLLFGHIAKKKEAEKEREMETHREILEEVQKQNSS